MQEKTKISNYILSFQFEDRRKGCKKKEGNTPSISYAPIASIFLWTL